MSAFLHLYCLGECIAITFSAAQTQDIKQSTQKMLRTILLLTQNMIPLPKCITLAMRLGYYEDSKFDWLVKCMPCNLRIHE